MAEAGEVGAEGVGIIGPQEIPIEGRQLLSRREQELLLCDLEITRRERDMATRSATVITPNNDMWSNLRQPIRAISELVCEFSGEQDTFWRWEKQFNLVRTTYALDDNAARVVIGMKLKGQALKWFHAKPEHLEMPIGNLLVKMRELFDYRPAKIELPRQFEKNGRAMNHSAR